MTSPFADAPVRVHHSTERRDIVYALVSDLYAMHGGAVDAVEGALLSRSENGIAVFRGDPDEFTRSGQVGTIGPVYRSESGALAVPTGLIFVRYPPGDDIGNHERELNDAGFEVAERLTFAAAAGWVRSRTGDIALTLAGVPLLEALNGIENVEPQFILERQLR